VKALWLLYFLIFLSGQVSVAQTAFTKPSEAYEFARQPLTDWEAALRAHKQPATPTLPGDIVEQRGKPLCPLFSVDSESGEELYWLAKLCEADPRKALLAVQRYLAGSNLAHGPDARLLLAILQMRATGDWQAAWPTFRTILKEDPAKGIDFSQIDVAIEDESSTAPEKALEWSRERYAILLGRTERDTDPFSTDSMLSAGSDLVHRYYLAGNTEQAAKVLDEMNRFVKSQPGEIKGWGAEELHWANLEMHSAPEIAVVKALGRDSAAGLIEPGRVEVLSFFFLGCAPCMRELSELNALQKRYGKKKLRVIGLTTYKMNSYLRPPTHSNIEASVAKTRARTARSVSFVMTPDETLTTYGINGFPVAVFVDKMGRIRYVGRDINFEDDDSMGRLIHRLVEE
jgi:thiol-disulfide isomerase/thioredoxin